MKKRLMLSAVALSALVPVLAQAQFARPEQAVRYRQSVFAVMGVHIGQLGAMVNGRVPFDAQQAAANAALVESLSRLPWQAFEEKANLLNTRARPEVWSEPAKFKAAADRMAADSTKLSAAAKTGDPGQLKVAFGALGASCKNCHDDFQKQ